MRYDIKDKTLTLYFEGHIDSANAGETEKEAMEDIGSNPHGNIVIDAKNLQYISSAGLRIILKIRKDNSSLKVINVSTDVYEVLEMTGFTEMMKVEKAYREFSVDGCEKLGEGSNGIVYRYDPEIVIKVYRNPDALEDIRRERQLARTALILGIPTAIPFDVVKVGDKFASVFELLNAKSFSKLIKAEPDKIDYYTGLFIDLLKQIHSTEVDPEDMPSMKAVALDWAEFLKAHLPKEEADKLYSLIDAVPERHTMIHGDYHTNNVEMQNGEVLLIDMDTLSYGHPIFEFASMYLAFQGFSEMDPGAVEKFLGLTRDVTTHLWYKSLELYLGTDDKKVIDEVSDKARVVAYARLLRRTIRRESDTEYGKRLIEHCKGKLSELLERVETLEF